MSDSVKVICRNCDRATIFSKDAIGSEIKRLSIYNYEILVCAHCQHKFSKNDFERARGIIKDPIIKKDPTIIFTPEDIEKKELETIRILAENLLEAKTKEDEIKKMQSGELFDPKIVGEIDMENGTPGDRRCVTILKKEGELYAYSFIAISRIFTFIIAIVALVCKVITHVLEFIWEIIKKINWCIVCSIARIGYFVGYIGLVIYGIVSVWVFNKPLFELFYDRTVNDSVISNPLYSYGIWTVVILLIFMVPLMLQLLWAFGEKGSRWSKVIQKRIDEIVR